LGAGQRPRPGNNIACNTTERITIYVKPGKPRKFPASVIAANEMPQAIKRDLAQQVWCMIPACSKDHRAPFPERLPARLIRLFAMMSAVTSSADTLTVTVMVPSSSALLSVAVVVVMTS
jgi:hypothetical protein